MEKKNPIRINESQLRNLIINAINERLEENRNDIFRSGIEDYQGTGSEESQERMEKIRAKRGDPDTKIPGKMWRDKGKGSLKHNDSSWLVAKKGFGGKDGKYGNLFADKNSSFGQFVAPLIDKYKSMPEGPAREALNELYWDLSHAYDEWAKKYDGMDFSKKEDEEKN